MKSRAWNAAEQELRHTVLGALKAQEFEKNVDVANSCTIPSGQNLTALGLQLDLMRMDLETVAPDVCARIGEIQNMLEEMMESVREYSYELNPPPWSGPGCGRRWTGWPSRARALPRLAPAQRGPVPEDGSEGGGAIYQIAQEAVENAVQHSGCSMIEIAVKPARAGNYLEVRDNGRGFDPADLQGGYRGLGLLSMEHYAAQAGLELAIVSRGTGRRCGPRPRDG